MKKATKLDRQTLKKLSKNGISIRKSTLNAPAEPLNSRNFCLTPKDRENVLKSRDEIAARMTSPLAYPCINIEAAWRKVYNLPKMERTKERYKNKEMELKIS